jgi:hypothetical protein
MPESIGPSMENGSISKFCSAGVAGQVIEGSLMRDCESLFLSFDFLSLLENICEAELSK